MAKAIGKTEHAKVGAVDLGKFYVVAKGDNPVTIAKKLKVPYDDLLALNHIEDPHKLQIGQKLLIPNKFPKAKKVDE
jgi:LysM repeat protein